MNSAGGRPDGECDGRTVGASPMTMLRQHAIRGENHARGLADCALTSLPVYNILLGLFTFSAEQTGQRLDKRRVKL